MQLPLSIKLDALSDMPCAASAVSPVPEADGVKKVDVTPLITHRFGFTAGDVAAAFDTASRASETGAIKVMFNL